jgi:hypothetical protein
VDIAVRTVLGSIMADDAIGGKDVDPNRPANERLSLRLTRFMMPFVNETTYMKLMREFAGLRCGAG